MNEHLALYRKYRPSKWSEVVGQEHIVKVLEGALKLGNISHAYLFTGSRGTGKTSIARIFAEAVGTSSSDLTEIDAASNRGIDDIRLLREGVNVLPFESKYKVYIIDEVHMLTREAFNALLKTLEEPPAHVIFILATTEMDKLPETIVSRCETHTFKKPSERVLKETILTVAKKEGFKIDSASAELIALLADGSFRDALGIVQKVLSSSKKNEISAEEVEMVTGAPRHGLVNDFLTAVSEKNVEKGFAALRAAVDGNIDMKIFAKLILQKLRAILLLSFGGAAEKELAENFSGEDMEFLKKIAATKSVNSQTLVALLDAYDQIGRSYLPQLPLELALVKLGS